MKTFEHSVVAESHMVTIQDAIIMAPLIDKIISSLNNKKGRENLCKIPWEKQKDYKHIEHPEINSPLLEQWLKILAELGFCGTGEVDIIPEGTPLVLKEENQ